MPTIYTDRTMVAAIVAATFPDYTGTKFKIVTCERVTITGLNWSGGTRSRYRACAIDGKPLGSMDRFNAMAPWENMADGQTTSLPRGTCIVSHTIFCGKDSGLTIFANAADLAPMLPAPASLSPIEATILNATAMYKSHYAGKDRYEHARDDTRYSEKHGLTFAAFPTRAQWDETKAALVARGLLNKAGAITNAGRNAIRRD